jgi:hypothetical protein
MQTRMQSVTEAVTSTLFSLVTSVVIGQYLIYPAFGFKPNWSANIELTLLFNAISLLRSYVVRRFFNWWNS